MRKEDIERLREEVDIVELVGEVVSLEKRGNNHVGLCPFHGEKTPSFNVSSARRRFHCFGCGINGDIFTWVQERELLSFPEAVRYLAERAGVAVEVGAKGSGKARVSAIDPRIETLRRVCKEAQEIFVSALTMPVGRVAYEYLRQRGLSRRIIETMGIGFAPFDALHHHGCKDPSLLTDAGLLMNNRFLFANRIIIPIRDEQGRVIGFAGRRLPQDDKGGKYINPPATPLYEKNKVLFGLDRARRALRAGQPLILVEGPLDAIALEQFGVEGAVASSGTAFTEEQAALMARRSREISPLLLFDGDRAGQEAAQKAAELLLRHGLNPRILTLASGDDPDSWVRRIGEEEAKDQLAAASPFLDTVIERLQTMPVGTIDQDAEREAVAARWLGAIPAGTLANAFGQAASQVLGRQVVAAAPRRRQRAPAPEVADDAPAEPEVSVMRPDHLDVPEVMRQLARQDAVAGAVWNTWQFVVMRRFERDLGQWGLTLPMLPVHAQPSALSEESRRVVLQAIEQMMRHQAAQVLGYHHGPITQWRPALSLCKRIADDAAGVVGQIEEGTLP